VTAPAAPGSTRLFIECSGTYHFDVNTGIQRVTRNIVRESLAQAAARGIEVIPVFHRDGRFWRARTSPDGRLETLPPPPPIRAERVRRAYRSVLRTVSAAVPHRGLSDWINAPGTHPGLTRELRRLARRVRRAPAPQVVAAERHEAAAMEAGDRILLVDLYVNAEFEDELRKLDQRGVVIGALVYDLIPIHHAELWHSEWLVGFRAWLDTVLDVAEVVVSISATVRDEIVDYASRLHQPWPHAGQRVAYFHLGHELDQRSREPQVRPELAALLADKGAPVFLNVGWFDPRKNQTFLIDALDSLWGRGIESKLLLVGRQGRGTRAIMRHLARTKRSAGRVFVFHDLTDDELDYCYAHADAMVYPSIEEGFGLPLVEALARGLRVFASDIPVFREIAGDFAVFFGLDSPVELSRLLERYCSSREYPAHRPVADFRWPDWRQSTTALLDIVLAAPVAPPGP
jgi:alpha-1,2-rhamnosyltransferase